jgi:hypothetical protein
VLRNIERQVQEFQRQQQQRDLQSEIEHHHKLPVDIQIGDQVTSNHRSLDSLGCFWSVCSSCSLSPA